MNASDSASPAYFLESDCDIEDFAALTSSTLDEARVPQASTIESNIPVYDMNALRPALQRNSTRQQLMQEWTDVMLNTAGAVILENACTDTAILDAVTDVYMRIIEQEKAQDRAGADHFAEAGKNDRIWNSLQKLCEQAPELYMKYFANPCIDAACEAWLGPNYQMTAQINLVYPGGAAQKAHRDYHLGFQPVNICGQFPAHVHALSPVMTLQGGIAHCDMPVESGPTRLLPFSQRYLPGYMAWRRDDFRAHFDENFVQVAMNKGDALFFNPAIFHAAGDNRSSDINRMVNLFQISSAFGRAMENMDRQGMCARLYPVVQNAIAHHELSVPELQALLSCTAEGYSFPTNLDTDPPVDGLAPETQKALFLRALDTGMSLEGFGKALEQQQEKKQA